MSRYLSPQADVVFKKIFGTRAHLLKSFLNAVLPLPPDGQIVSLEYLTGEQVPVIPEFKRTIVDVKCTDKEGRIFIVEMQTDWIGGFMQRMLFNTACAYVYQLKKGEDYKLLCPVYGLGIISDKFDFESEDWYHHYKIVNVQNSARTIDGLELVFLELPKFHPNTKSDKHLCVLWLRFLLELNERTKAVPEEFLAVPEIKEACELSEEAAYTPWELDGYNQYWDAISTAKTLASGNFEKGKAEGKAEGLAEGEAKGLAKGIAQERAAILQKLLTAALSPEQISSILED